MVEFVYKGLVVGDEMSDGLEAVASSARLVSRGECFAILCDALLPSCK